ncbi:hypothetical protein QUG02_13015 [Bacillus hominis]|uniref:C1q domain-containing protein n=1 Tax=Bacillus hominis TaxID=2817478 RepID=A0ABT7R7X2_9BACI|nr:hypothetical protein [Bacillus hominis]MDM5433599.1 hypothetical protein [Bacillus hominis]MDM5439023.1 hypothetical protein [Bacillus hominis]
MYSCNGKNFNHCAFPVPIPGPQGIQGPPGPVPQSAFKAVTDNQQPYTVPVTPTPVTYEIRLFDLNDEYDVMTSTFIPKQNGVYFVLASIGFFSEVANKSLELAILVNDETTIIDNENFSSFFFSNPVISVSGTLLLNAGDKVTVSHTNSGIGLILSAFSSTHFEATRLPSPL